jgi:hypothetical protein
VKFGSIDYHMLICKNHLDATNAWATEIELFLVQYLIVRICAELEDRIPILFERRCSRGIETDVQLTQFAIKTIQYVTKRFSIKDLGIVLKRFDDGYHAHFNQQVTGNNSHVAWDSIYNNRHAVAHGAGIQMTFNDLAKAYQDCLPVFDALIQALGLTLEEIKDLA